MCLLFVGYRMTEEAPLIIAFNRDEDLVRPTAPLHFWHDYPDVLAGRDRVKRGTWGGINRDGYAAFLTFVHQEEKGGVEYLSRGQIPHGFLTGRRVPFEYLRHLKMSRDQFMGYNLLYGSIEGLHYFSNVTGESCELSPGIHSVSNAFLNTPWPKTVRGVTALESFSKRDWLDAEKLLALMKDDGRAEWFPTGSTNDEQDPDWDRSTIMVRGSDWGTRSSSVIHFFNDGRIRFEECTHDLGGTSVVYELTSRQSIF